MKIYLLLLLLGLSLGAYRIPTFGSNQGYAGSYFYLDVSSIKYGESINIQVTFYGYSSENCWLYYKGSSSYSDSEFTSGFSYTSSNTHSVTSSYYYDSYYSYSYEHKHSFYFTVTKTTYNYLLLKVDKDSRYYVYIYHNRYNYLWVIWLVIGIVFVCLLIFLICFIKRRRAAQLALESQVSTLATPVYQPPVNAYQPQPQPQQYAQPAYPPQYQYAQPPPY
jgi:hypothetical protein